MPRCYRLIRLAANQLLATRLRILSRPAYARPLSTTYVRSQPAPFSEQPWLEPELPIWQQDEFQWPAQHWPARALRYDPQSWCDALDKTLPRSGAEGWHGHFRRPVDEVLGAAYALVIGARHFVGLELISQICLAKGRWLAVDGLVWILIRHESLPPLDPLSEVQPLYTLQDSNCESLDSAADIHPSLDEIRHAVPDRVILENSLLANSRGEPLVEHHVARELLGVDPKRNLKGHFTLQQAAGDLFQRRALAHAQTLDNLTEGPYSLPPEYRDSAPLRLKGHIWEALGHIVLKASQSEPAISNELMQHVISWFARLQYHGMIPDRVYQPATNQDSALSGRPSLVSPWSSKILATLEDANSAANAADSQGNSANGITRQGDSTASADIPIGVYMELILWTCVHNGFALHCSNLLAKMSLIDGDHQWSLIDQQSLIQQEHGKGAAENLADIERNQTARSPLTVSSKVVSAVINILTHSIRPSRSDQEASAQSIVESISLLKNMLDRNQLPADGHTWDSLVVRMSENKGVEVDQEPEFALRVLEFAHPSKDDVSHDGVQPHDSSSGSQEQNSKEPSGAIIGLYHRALRALLRQGNIIVARRALMQLVAYMNAHRQEEWEEDSEHHESLQQQSDGLSGRRVDPSDSNAQAMAQLADTRIPPPILAELLDLFTKSGTYELAEWLITGKDAGGPFISRDLFADPSIAPALLSFANATGRNSLVDEILDSNSPQESDEGKIIDNDLLTALLATLIDRNQWQFVSQVYERLEQRDIARGTDHSWRPSVAVIVACFMIRQEARIAYAAGSTGAEGLDLAQGNASRIFRLLFDRGYSYTGRGNSRRELNAILGILSTLRPQGGGIADRIPRLRQAKPRKADNKAGIDSTTKEPAHQLEPDRQDLVMSTDRFNTILSAVAETYGSAGALRLWTIWCHQLPWHNPKTLRAGSRSIEPDSTDAHFPRRARSTVRHIPLTSRNKFVPDPRTTKPSVAVSGTQVQILFEGRIVPNMATVRIILRAALKELTAPQRQKGQQIPVEDFAIPAASSEKAAKMTTQEKTAIARASASTAKTPAEVLAWVRETFMAMSMREKDVEDEIRLAYASLAAGQPPRSPTPTSPDK